MHSQIEQEFDLIIGKSSFVTNWSTKCIPAILQSSSKSAKACIKRLTATIDEIGTYLHI